jgi:hypothetical protein
MEDSMKLKEKDILKYATEEEKKILKESKAERPSFKLKDLITKMNKVRQDEFPNNWEEIKKLRDFDLEALADIAKELGEAISNEMRYTSEHLFEGDQGYDPQLWVEKYLKYLNTVVKEFDTAIANIDWGP